MLSEETEYWWDNTRFRLESVSVEITWANFNIEFLDKYREILCFSVLVKKCQIYDEDSRYKSTHYKNASEKKSESQNHDKLSKCELWLKEVSFIVHVISCGRIIVDPYKKELNMRKRRLLELLKDYDFKLSYHYGKTNVVEDVLSRKSLHISALMARELDFIEQFRDLILVCEVTPKSLHLDFIVDENGIMKSWDRVCNPDVPKLRKKIMEESHRSSLSIHLEVTKKYQDIKKMFWWPGFPNTAQGSDSIWVVVDRLRIKVHVKVLGELAGTLGNQVEVEFCLLSIDRRSHREDYSVFGRSIESLCFRARSYHYSIGMSLFEALYDRRCRTPLRWYESNESVVLEPEIVQQTIEKVKMIQEKTKASQIRQKRNHDKWRKTLEFQEGNHVFLRVTLMTCAGHALKSQKLTHLFIGPYQILQRIGVVSYRVSLPLSISNLHSFVHVSQL
ncbi:uncharacterized protein LOC131604607 [Vicia villosa]|uniref:uncharacterized protein LOC131604607 n=1 Tax=Vicia villosa TaxID=3911 RepID=UPI00273AD09D|nr:uncharacterized protein LOC131604607 [Vicia villosa]